jgi:hypothetical protein
MRPAFGGVLFGGIMIASCIPHASLPSRIETVPQIDEVLDELMGCLLRPLSVSMTDRPGSAIPGRLCGVSILALIIVPQKRRQFR